MTTTVDAVEYAKELLFAVLDEAKKARKNARYKDLTTEIVAVPAPYAREWRLILSAVARRLHVFAVGTPRGVGGKYRNGYDVTLYGFSPDIIAVLDEWARIRQLAESGMKVAQPLDGEDTGTMRSSFLLGFQLALTGWQPTDGVDEQTAVEERIKAPITQDPLNVQMRSTGSAAYAGFLAGKAVDDEPANAAA